MYRIKFPGNRAFCLKALMMLSIIYLSACSDHHAKPVTQSSELAIKANFDSRIGKKPNLLPLTELFNSTHCNIGEEKISRLRDQQALNGILIKSRSHLLNAQPPELLPVNFETTNVYLITMGTQPSAGYAIAVKDSNAVIHDDAASLRLEYITPDKQTMSAQMLTSPCIILSLPKGDYHRLIISRE